MGKGKGKKGKREETLVARAAKKALKAARKARQTPRQPRSARAPKPADVLRKKLIADLKPVVATPTGAKWPSLFKRHLGVIETHIRTLDRVVQSMKSAMRNMDAEEREKWATGEKGNWVVLCGLIDRARELLASARIAAKGILPENLLKDKKGLGVIGITWEPQTLQFVTKTEKSQSFPVSGSATTMEDILGDAQMSDGYDDASSSKSETSQSSEVGEPAPAPFVPRVFAKVGVNGDSEYTNGDSGEAAVESNPYFVVDTNPSPVVANGSETKKSKKRANEDDEGKAAKKIKKSNKAKTATLLEEPEGVAPAAGPRQVDFALIEAQLQAEVRAGLEAKSAEAMKQVAEQLVQEAKEEKAATKERKEKKKKRRRSEVSDGGDGAGEEIVETEAKKEKKQKKDKSERGELIEKHRDFEKSAKKEKKEKKRKTDESAEGETIVEEKTSKKKRKHKEAEA